MGSSIFYDAVLLRRYPLERKVLKTRDGEILCLFKKLVWMRDEGIGEKSSRQRRAYYYWYKIRTDTMLFLKTNRQHDGVTVWRQHMKEILDESFLTSNMNKTFLAPKIHAIWLISAYNVSNFKIFGTKKGNRDNFEMLTLLAYSSALFVF